MEEHEKRKDALRELRSCDPDLAKAIDLIRGVVEASNRVAAVYGQQRKIQQEETEGTQLVGGVYTAAAF